MPEEKKKNNQNKGNLSIPLYESGKSHGAIPLYEIADELTNFPEEKEQKETSLYYG